VAGADAEVARLHAALEEYSYHKSSCAVRRASKQQWPDCTCGLDEAKMEKQ